MAKIADQFVQMVHNKVFWWPFTYFRPEEGQKMSKKKLVTFLIVENLVVTAFCFFILSAIYIPFAEYMDTFQHIYWNIVLVTLAIGLALNTLLYITFAILWNRRTNEA